MMDSIGCFSNARYYAGIGARSTPDNVLNIIHRLSGKLLESDFVLRSGGAPGADHAFEIAAQERSEIYIPWPFYERHSIMMYPIIPEAMEIAEKHHPNWDNLAPAVRLLMARNTMQILGDDCNNPSEFVICWTKDGVTEGKDTTPVTGGTGQAIRVASTYGIPVFNINTKDIRQMLRYIGEQFDIETLKDDLTWLH